MADGNVPTNAEVIEDLTKDLQSAQVTESDDLVKNDPENEEDDVSDDEALKNQELDLTEEEKKVRREEALTLKNQGNEELKSRNYVESIETYTKALRCCPLKFSSDRAILYANRAASKIQIGRKVSAIEDCSKAITLDDKYVRAYLRRAKLYEEEDKLDESLADYQQILKLDPGNKDALNANVRLPPLINERNEKLKEEMFGKLKDLGNMILKPFGLSTDNFKMQQDPNTGGYSVNFQQNNN